MMCYGIFCDFRMFLKLFAGSAAFSRKHPLACYVSSMLMCFATSIVSNFLVGESLVIPLKNHQELIVASAVWYDLLRDGVSRCFIFLCLSVRQKSVYCCATEYSQPVHHQLVRKISGKTPSSCKHNANPNAHPTTKQSTGHMWQVDFLMSWPIPVCYTSYTVFSKQSNSEHCSHLCSTNMLSPSFSFRSRDNWHYRHSTAFLDWCIDWFIYIFIYLLIYSLM